LITKNYLSKKKLNESIMDECGKSSITFKEVIGFIVLLYVLAVIIQVTTNSGFLAYFIALILAIAIIWKMGWLNA